jgi:hypothetical protein
MTKLLSTKEAVRFVPPGTASGASDNAITYDLRVPTVYDRARLRRGCLARGARHWSDLEMMPVLEAGVRELLGSEAESELRDRFLAVIEAYTAHLAANDEPPSELALRISDIEAAVARGYGPYAERVADRTYWTDILPIEAARLLVVAWEGIEVECIPGPNGLNDAALDHIPKAHLTPLGFKALSLFGPTEDKSKN